MFLKLKNKEVTIKVRGCADGRNQENWLSKQDTSPPTVSTEGFMLPFIIDEMKDRDVATDDIPISFLQDDYDKGDIHIKMEGAVVTLLEEIDPAYYKDFIYIVIRGEIYVCRIQEGYIRHSKLITNFLKKISNSL